MTYDEKVAALTVRIAPRATKLVKSYGEAFQRAGYGWNGEDFHNDGDEYYWEVTCTRPDSPREKGEDWPEDAIDVRLHLCEQRQYEKGEDLTGIAFRIDVVEVSGRVLGDQTHYNYTSDVWVDIDDEAAIEARFALFAEADPENAVLVVNGQRTG